ncbi:MAG: hypothetical protein GOVbin5978_20 [Prokaryotic dsDNA virus sp.]|nr:MAG: hypothetical protein GOVbin5978_20 [Prokaryotic dsDNA virus sp.]|tara:strand:- start:26674 stop:28584 length:1911 start_codon:yes stop_codon:yes gene_type:complete
MPSNFHSDLPNDQLHDPKDFALANNSSALVKDERGDLSWKTPPYDLETTIECASDVSGGLHNTSFFIEKDASTKYQVYFEVAGQTTTPTIVAGYTGAKVTIITNDTNVQVGNDLTRELRAKGFTVVDQNTGRLVVSGMSDVNDTIDDNTDFGFSNRKIFNSTTVLTSTNGAISWTVGSGGGGAVSDVATITAGTSTGTPITISPTKGNVKVRSNAYDGGNKVGHVPAGGDSTKFLRGDGTWQAVSSGGTTYAGGGGIDIDTTKTPNVISIDSNVVITKSDNQYITGDKEFAGNVIMNNATNVYVPIATVTDNSARAASTAWVNNQHYGQGTLTKVETGDGLNRITITTSSDTDGKIELDNTVIRNFGTQSIGGDKTFNNHVQGVTASRGDSTVKLATCEFVQNEISNLGGGTVQTVTASSPLKSTGGANPDISIPRASSSAAGFLSQTDYNTFNSKQNRLTLTTTGTGPATLVGATLNIPQSAEERFTKSFRGSVDVSRAGTYFQTTSGRPLAHTIDISKGNKSIDFINGAFHFVVTGREVFGMLGGIVEGTGDIKFQLWSMQVDCAGVNQPTFKMELETAFITLVPNKPVCWLITTGSGKKLTINPGTSLVLGIVPGQSDAVVASYNAHYSSITS